VEPSGLEAPGVINIIIVIALIIITLMWEPEFFIPSLTDIYD
jgi:hypothetical protein